MNDRRDPVLRDPVLRHLDVFKPKEYPEIFQ